MRKLISTSLVALTLITLVGLVPARANATGYEDSLDDCAYPKVFDALVLKPLSFGVMVVGAVGLGLFTATIVGPAMLHRDYPEFATMMVVPAASFAVARPLGECSSSSVEY